MKLFLKILGTKYIGTIAYYSQTNRAIELLNKTLGYILSKYLTGKSYKHWDLYLA